MTRDVEVTNVFCGLYCLLRFQSGLPFLLDMFVNNKPEDGHWEYFQEATFKLREGPTVHTSFRTLA